VRAHDNRPKKNLAQLLKQAIFVIWRMILLGKYRYICGTALLLLFASALPAEEIVDRWLVGGYFSYGANSAYVPRAGRIIDSFMTNADAGTPGFGITATRGLTKHLGLGGEVMFQVYKWTSHTYGFDIGPIYWPKRAQDSYEEGPSGADVRYNILAHALYLTGSPERMRWEFRLGGGIYSYSEARLGFHGGILGRFPLTNTATLFLGPRCHIIPQPSTWGAIVQFVVGIDWSVEKK